MPLQLRPIPLGDDATLAEHRRRPGARLYAICTLCGWNKGYAPAKVARRLAAMKAGGEAAPLDRIARHIGWPCPGCGRVKWRTALAYPPELDPREIRRLERRLRD